MLAHSAGGVRLDHYLNTGIFEGTFRQIRLGAAGVGLDDKELGVLHRNSICPDEWVALAPRPG